MTGQDLFNGIFDASLAVMVASIAASLGISLTVREILAPLRRLWLLTGTVLVNSILAPFIAIGVCDLFSINGQGRVGLELATMAAGATSALKAAAFTKHADMAMALSFIVVLNLANMVAVPLWADHIISGATVDSWALLKNLALVVLVPLAIGLVLRHLYSEQALGWKPGLETISNIALLVVLALGIGGHWKLLVHTIGSRTLIASVVIVVLYAVSGWIVGVRDQSAAIAISMVSSLRFGAIGLIVIASTLNNEGAYLAPALIFCLVDMIVPFVLGLEIGRYLGRAQRPEQTQSTTVPQPA
jgi:BASS family bile acid:Na+ symporter